ncbi:MAG: hypothetical protein Q9188_006879 [Gyalolechia gomerana]
MVSWGCEILPKLTKMYQIAQEYGEAAGKIAKDTVEEIEDAFNRYAGQAQDRAKTAPKRSELYEVEEEHYEYEVEEELYEVEKVVAGAVDDYDCHHDYGPDYASGSCAYPAYGRLFSIMLKHVLHRIRAYHHALGAVHIGIVPF